MLVDNPGIDVMVTFLLVLMYTAVRNSTRITA